MDDAVDPPSNSGGHAREKSWEHQGSRVHEAVIARH